MPGRRRELVALVLLAVAVFLFVVLLASGSGGVLGRGSAAGLTFAFGHLALVVPLALAGLAVTTVLSVTLRRSYLFLGIIVFLFGLVPPGGRGRARRSAGTERTTSRSAEFEGRAGGLGEALYALFHRLAGTIGVGIVGWVAVVAGFSLATGVTARRLAITPSAPPAPCATVRSGA